MQTAIASCGIECESFATNINTTRIGDKVIKKVSLRENGYNAPAIENIYPLREDRILKRKYIIKNSLVITIPDLITIFPKKKTDNIKKERRKLGIIIE